MWILSASLDVWANRTCAQKGQTEDRAVIASPALAGGTVKLAAGADTSAEAGNWPSEHPLLLQKL
jgi:hypothetical protein